MTQDVMSQKNLLILGGSGFFASHLLPKLAGYNVTCIVRSGKSILSGVDQVKTYSEFGEVGDSSGYDFVLDFASKVSVEDFIKRPLNMFSENLNITLKHLSMLEETGFSGHYIYVSTDRALLSVQENAFMNEVNISNDPYGACKLFSEMVAGYGCTLKGIKSSTLRFPNLYGKGQKSNQLLPMILNKIHLGERRIVLKSLSGNRNYLHVSDAVNAILKFLKNPVQHKNVCISGENVELREVCNHICDIFENATGESLEFLESSQTNARSNYLEPPAVLDDCYFRSVYGWKPKINMREGLKQLLIEGK